MLSTSSSLPQAAAGYNITVRTEYTLSATTIGGAASDCPSTCLYTLQPMYFSNNTVNEGTFSVGKCNHCSAAMARPGDSYANLTNAPFPVMYCAIGVQTCGADIPLFVYYNSSVLGLFRIDSKKNLTFLITMSPPQIWVHL